MLVQQAHAREIRQRLMNPTNAVPDEGIDLKRVKEIPVIQREEPVYVPVIYRKPTEIDHVRKRIAWALKILDKLEMRAAIVDNSRRPTVEAIMRATCAHFNVTYEDMISPRRTDKIVRPRQVAAYIAKQITIQSMPQIGRRMGGRDHTTVLHSIRKIDEMRFTNESIADAIRQISSRFRNENRAAPEEFGE